MDKLVEAARQARTQAYAPYSGFQVGAAVLTADGSIFSGCNVENAAYGLTNCAERTALFTAVAAGQRQFVTLAVIADSAEPVAPCGACRQVMDELGVKTVIMSNLQGQIQVVSVNELLPYAFGKKQLSGENL